MSIINNISEILSEIKHPEINNDIISSKIVSDIRVIDNKINIELFFSRKIDPFKKRIILQINEALKNNALFEGYDINVFEKIIETKSSTKVHSSFNKIIAISSGKGGVGKSTVASNIAISIANKGYSVGILDADIFGPSIPKMFGLTDDICETELIEEKHFIVPHKKYGVSLMSIGFLIKHENPVIWRGPMASNALKQLINDTLWGNLDYLILDLPPGTSDIHLSITKFLNIDFSIIVTTPQEISIADTIKGINMFRQKDFNIPIMGIIENMYCFIPEDNPDKQYFIFGKNKVEKISTELNIDIIAKIPITENLAELADEGKPISTITDSKVKEIYFKLANNIINYKQ